MSSHGGSGAAYAYITHCTTVSRPTIRFQSIDFTNGPMVLNAAALLISPLPRFSHISTLMTAHLHWLPLTARIQFKVLFLTCKTFVQAQRYLCDLIRRPILSQLPLDVLSALLVGLQCCPTCGPRAACGPWADFKWPARVR